LKIRADGNRPDMNEHAQDKARGDKHEPDTRETMKSPRGRGQKTAGDREVMGPPDRNKTR
jgi:hypothetical protein